MISKGYLMHLYISDLHVLLITKMFIWNASKPLKIEIPLPGYICFLTSFRDDIKPTSVSLSGRT